MKTIIRRAIRACAVSAGGVVFLLAAAGTAAPAADGVVTGSPLKVAPVKGKPSVDWSTNALSATNVVEEFVDPDMISAKADRLDYDRASGWVNAVGHAVVRKGKDVIHADRVRYNVETEDAEAVGRVVMNRDGNILKSDRIVYNFKTRTGKLPEFVYKCPPFQIVGKNSENLPNKDIRLQDAQLTTCTNGLENSHYHVSSSSATITPEECARMKHNVIYLGPVPILYLPYWYRNLKEDFGFRFYPGYHSDMGAFLLSSYRYRLTPYLKAETHVDYRAKRGVAYGQDFKWRNGDNWYGDVTGYYLDDKAPLDDEDVGSTLITNERYRGRLRHTQYFSARDYLISQVGYLSDPDIIEDFFEDEYREANQPDNYLVFTHRGDQFTADLQLRGRLNDFYEGVNRLPEGGVQFMRQPIGETYLYYEGQTAAAFLQRVFPKGSDPDADYSAFRIDSSHMIYYPDKYFGFLNLIPRVGYRATHYSETKTTVSSIEYVTVTRTNMVASGSRTSTVVTASSQTNMVARDIKGPAELRNRFEIGLEASLKAFKTWNDEFGGWRHVVEPYANYTMVPEPNLLPDRLNTFDGVDTLGKEHYIGLGLRNKLQTKVDDAPYDLADVNVFTTYRLETEEGEDPIDSFGLDAKTWPAEGVQLNFDGSYSVALSEVASFNTRLIITTTNYFCINLEHRYTPDSSLINSTLTLMPSRAWDIELYTRYDFESKRLEEQWLYLTRKFDCLTFRLGGGTMPGYTRSDGYEVEDEYRAVFEMWLTAFPESSLGSLRHAK